MPVTRDRTVLDLALAAGASILVAGRAGLGTINHTLLTFEAIASRGGRCLGAVLLDPVDAVSETERAENIRAIEDFSGLPVHEVVGRIDDLRNPDPRHLAVLARVLDSDPS